MAVTLAPAAQRAVVVPDPAFWALAGVDVFELEVEPVASPSRADLLVLPAEVPEGLAEAVRETRSRLPDPDAVRVVEGLGLGGVPVGELAEPGHGVEHEHGGEEHEHGDGENERGDHGHDHGGHDHGHGGDHDPGGHDHGHGGGHDHGDMMAVTGKPSADGLIMEDADATIGPLGPALATGLVWRARLDGDVVCESRIDSVLGGPAAGGAPDPLARSASRLALERAGAAERTVAGEEGAGALEGGRVAAGERPGGGGGGVRVVGEPGPARVPLRIAAVEVERALGHLMWLARFAQTIGCLALADRLHRAARPLIRVQGEFLGDGEARPELPDPDPVREALAAVRSTRGLAARSHGIGVVGADRCREDRIGGPVARAAGLRTDARAHDPAYLALGFEPALRTAGDAESRAAVRIEEADASLELAQRALEAAELPHSAGPVEGPRGPLFAEWAGPSGAAAFTAPGAAATRELAAASACGHELARAVVAVASFDLGPWAVSG